MFSRVFLMSSHAEKSYLEIEFQDGVGWFWKEKQGLSGEVLGQFENHLKSQCQI
jgi:tRNA (cytidine/uridine-2'-O-)-methyltransferase